MSNFRENNEQEKILFPRITMIGQRVNNYKSSVYPWGYSRSVIEVVMDIPMAAHAEAMIEQIKIACNGVRNAIEEETGQSFYYGLQQKDDIWRSHPGVAVYIDFANNDDFPIETVHSKEHRVLPRFAEAIEGVLATFRESPAE